MKSAAHVVVLSAVALVGVAVLVRIMAGTVGNVNSSGREPMYKDEVWGIICSAHIIS